jgi:LysM repeat protein/catechol 2,3-dioxygenase-like lactoylglutathione lyase family enzyme
MPQNRSLKKLVMLALLLGALLTLASGSLAQQGDNLLRDPGFEDTAMKVISTADSALFAVNNDWGGWFTETPRTVDWQNRVPFGTGRINVGHGFVRNGNRSMELSRGYATFTAAVYQTVTVPANSIVTGGAWVVMNISGDNAGEARSHARVGIDPTGGTNPLAGSVVWSNQTTNALASGGWRELTATATAQGTQVTLFLYATQEVPTQGNGTFWDDAYLRVTGAGNPNQPTAIPGTTATPVPPPPPSFVPFVNPQGQQSDGSIVHTVQENDTLSSIAVAYNVPMDIIRDLNPHIGQGRYISVGDTLLIQRANTGPSSGTGLGPSAPLPIPTEVAAVVTTEPNTGTDPVVVQPPVDLPTQEPVVVTQEPIIVQPTTPTVRLHTLYLFANDLDAVVHFYSDILGLESQIAEDHVIFKLDDLNLVYLLAETTVPVLTEWQRQPIYDGGTVESATFTIEVIASEFALIAGRAIADPTTSAYKDAVLVTDENQHAMFLQDPMGYTVGILSANE